MTDPLSVTAGAIAVIGVCTTCAKQLDSLRRGFRDAPEEILALSNEISDMTVVLTEVKAIYQDVAITSKLVMFSLYQFKRT